MDVGALARLPELGEIPHVTPSSAGALAECGLRAAYERDYELRREVPSSQAARLGSACHEVLEEAGKGSLGDPGEAAWEESFERIWEAAIARQRSQAEQHELEGGWPAPRRWSGYALRKARTRRLARALSGQSAAPVRLRGEARFEESQSAFEGRLRGRPDVVTRGARHAVIDYKSGAIYEESGELKHAYRRQLLLYSVLEHEASGEWPTEASIVPLSGEPASTKVVPAEAEQVAAEAIGSLRDHNARVVGALSAQELADPSAEHCRWCPFAVRCPAFWEAAEPHWSEDHWIAVAGIAHLYRPSTVGTADLDLDAALGSGERGLVTVHGLPERQFAGIEPGVEGRSVAATGLRPLRGSTLLLRPTAATRIVVA